MILKEKLWSGLKDRILDLVVSDHSPCIEELKKSGNFIISWGGISSVQFGLSLFWSQAKLRDFDIQEVAHFLSSAPSKLCGLENRKGAIKVGLDADFVVWDSQAEFEVREFFFEITS